MIRFNFEVFKLRNTEKVSLLFGRFCYYLQTRKYHVMWLFFILFLFAYPDTPSDEYKIEPANIIPKKLRWMSNDYKKISRIVSSRQELSILLKIISDKSRKGITIHEEIMSPLYFTY